MRFDHDALAGDVDRWRTPIRDSGRPNASRVEHWLEVSVRHLTAAALGERLEAAYNDRRGQLGTVLPGIDHHAVVTGAGWMVFGGAVATIDACAAAAVHWSGSTPDDDDGYDLNALIDGSGRARQFERLETWTKIWVEQTYHDPGWPSLIERRNLHAQAPLDTGLDLTVETTRPDSANEAILSASEVFAAAVGFTHWRWRAFWTALTTSE